MSPSSTAPDLSGELKLALSEQLQQSLIKSFELVEPYNATVELLEGVRIHVQISQYGYNHNTTRSEDIEGLLRACSPAYSERSTTTLMDKLIKVQQSRE